MFCSSSDRARGPPSILYNGYGVSFPGIKRPGRSVYQPLPYSAEVKERVKLHLYTPSWHTMPVIRGTLTFTVLQRSRDSSVSIATGYGLEGPGIEFRWGEIFCTYPDRLRGPPSLLYNGYRVFPGGKDSRGVMLTTHPLLVPRLRKS
jgi:hypothetical protein